MSGIRNKAIYNIISTLIGANYICKILNFQCQIPLNKRQLNQTFQIGCLFLALTFVALGILNSTPLIPGWDDYGEVLQGSKNSKLEHSLLNGFIRLYSH